ncbi:MULTISPECIES: P-type conjugative transfer protein TrbJ [Acidithiobacillus]|jgi:P-type conjugative transfer protein TrbJ|uniref:P-type conjugative transfer protein TrbJ n=2 Tax=Acidithiobacillus ferrooxidans TaxID=920 RepID=A0A2W1KLJ1_ACIFR|nr:MULTISPECIES: P-type conjugative transfer protein TrbJ [Acidithiobacillus]MBE7566323.1 P-type conjugative transfer protein TrbJ [Acidithiobacillus sp. HP-11]MCR0969991.1 P-type conjugative transfer protein TrbJ [Acidithiobacillus ferrooxidans]MCR1349421.1 P-type conjugative transfer protein TrbJ [Acidithiobacillus ferrooxidans]MCR1351418.1 P-type conjugative transfer protein TrbJ [Acidithiobacillus ferrooxidans]PZD80221.1 P-type conjugative transfer protein TrbJ [Acidithiobacillus ferrooxid
MSTKSNAFILGAILALLPTSAFAVSEIAGATFPEQIVQEATSVEQLAKQAQEVTTQISMYANDIERYQNMVTNTLDMPASMFARIWNPLVGSIQKLTSIYSQAQALGYAGQNIGAQLAQEYQGAGSSIQNLSSVYANWNQTTNTDMEDALQSQHLAAANFATQDSSMQTIQNEAQTAQGREQVAAAAVAAANVTTKSIQQLEQITMAGQDAVLAYQRQKKAEKNVTAQEASDGLFSGGTNNPSLLP